MDETLSDRTPPQDRQAEVSLLGALLIDNSYIPNVCTIINSEDFYDRRHRIVFEAIVALF
jgi:replicative DNA helicase